MKSEKKKKRASSFSAKLLFPMIMLSALQITTLFGALYVSGEFTSVRQYAYNMLIEKTENRKNYIENMFLRNISDVYQTDIEINSITQQILNEKNQSISELSIRKLFRRQLRI